MCKSPRGSCAFSSTLFARTAQYYRLLSNLMTPEAGAGSLHAESILMRRRCGAVFFELKSIRRFGHSRLRGSIRDRSSRRSHYGLRVKVRSLSRDIVIVEDLGSWRWTCWLTRTTQNKTTQMSLTEFRFISSGCTRTTSRIKKHSELY